MEHTRIALQRMIEDLCAVNPRILSGDIEAAAQSRGIDLKLVWDKPVNPHTRAMKFDHAGEIYEFSYNFETFEPLVSEITNPPAL